MTGALNTPPRGPQTPLPNVMAEAPVMPDIFERTEALFARLMKADTLEALSEHMAAIATAVGFQSRLIYQTTTGEPLLLSRMAEWEQRYREANYYRIDPVLRQARNRALPFRWGRALTGGSGESARMMRDAAAHGLAEGICIPLHGPPGGFGLFVAGAKRSSGEVDRELIRYAGLLRMLAWTTRERLLELMPELCTNLAEVKLTPRERDCLRLLAGGLTNAQIADDLEISSRTVHYHLENARRKLDASGRVDMVVRAVRTGLIEL